MAEIRTLSLTQWVTELEKLVPLFEKQRVEVLHEDAVMELRCGPFVAEISLRWDPVSFSSSKRLYPRYSILAGDLTGTHKFASDHFSMVGHLIDLLNTATARLEGIEVVLS